MHHSRTAAIAGQTQNSYDQVPYQGIVNARTHPDHLATIATLMGMSPQPIQHCRVLELGCASGENLLPMAFHLPQSEFVGIDLSARQIAQGQQKIDELGLHNAALHHLNIMELNTELGSDDKPFDYIIAKGVYSWVPPVVQDKILEACKRLLAPHGVAYVDYNVYPGWHMRGLARDLMLFATHKLTEPQAKLERAAEALNLIAAAHRANEHSPYHRLLDDELSLLDGKSASYILHEHLEDYNEPLYFHQFMERATQHGLQYLSEADLSLTLSDNLPPAIAHWVEEATDDRIEFEQHLDFLRNRIFRQTLLCHQAAHIASSLRPIHVAQCYLASRAQQTGAADGQGRVSFKGIDGALFTTNHPLTQAAFAYLQQQWPCAVSFEALLARVGGLPPSGQDVQILAANVLKAHSYSGHLIELHSYAPALTNVVGERPTASAWARHEVHSETLVTNLWHHPQQLHAFDHFVLKLLDGQHDRRAIIEQLFAGPVASGALTIEEQGQPVREAEYLRQKLSEELEESLNYLKEAALLTS